MHTANFPSGCRCPYLAEQEGEKKYKLTSISPPQRWHKAQMVNAQFFLSGVQLPTLVFYARSLVPMRNNFTSSIYCFPNCRTIMKIKQLVWYCEQGLKFSHYVMKRVLVLLFHVALNDVVQLQFKDSVLRCWAMSLQLLEERQIWKGKKCCARRTH